MSKKAWSGRKRKPGRRTSSGELVRTYVNFREMAAEQPHRRDLPASVKLDQRAESPFGRLCLTGEITDAQYEAGRLYAVIVGRYRASIEAPRGMAGTGRGYDCKGEKGCYRDDHPCECRTRKIAYDAAFEAISEAGHRAQVALNRVAVHGGFCPHGYLDHLRRGLTALMRHFGLTADRKGNTGN